MDLDLDPALAPALNKARSKRDKFYVYRNRATADFIVFLIFPKGKRT
jgi:hypothetical protein